MLIQAYSPPASRYDLVSLDDCRRFIARHFPWLRLHAEPSHDFRVSLNYRAFGSRRITTAYYTQSCHIQPEQPLRDHRENGHCKIIWVHTGSIRLIQDARQCTLPHGQVILCDASVPYTLHLAPDTCLSVLTLPHDTLPDWHQYAHLLSVRPMRNLPCMQTALTTARTLLQGTELSMADANAILQSVQWLLQHAFLQQLQQHADTTPDPRMAQAHAFICQHLSNPALSPAMLATALHISRRTLYALFRQHSMTPSQYIRWLRLAAIRQALAQQTQTHKSILMLALEHGFNDAASFSRMFKQAFGVSPHQWRHQNLAETTCLHTLSPPATQHD